MIRTFSAPLCVVIGLGLAAGLTGCGTTHPLPLYERPIARTEYQTVRTTAYTHTEADHLEYGNHNALGGTLHAASAPGPVAIGEPAAALEPNPTTVVNEEGGFHRAPPEPPSAAAGDAYAGPVAIYGSAAADWSRWPAGTVFRIESTGQVYRVDDYGWALAGRNTIDLYKSNRNDMNEWGVRREAIHVLRWGDRAASLRMLRGHQNYRHIHRMVLELEGRERAAANLE